MEPGRVPIPIVWPHGGNEVYVTGDFNCYSLVMLTGDAEKFCVVWCDPGVHLYRFMVDGSYKCDLNKPVKESEDVLYNVVEVADLPQPISNLHLLSLEDLEKLDSQLFQVSQQDLEKRIYKIKAFLRRVVDQKRFKQKKYLINKIKAWLKGRKQRKRFQTFQTFLKFKVPEKSDKETMTEPLLSEPSDSKTIEDLKKTIEELKSSNESLSKRLEALKSAQDKKKLPPPKKPDPPLISIKEFLTPSKPLSFRDGRADLTPKSRATFTKFSKK
jgi:hypothetical protein